MPAASTIIGGVKLAAYLIELEPTPDGAKLSFGLTRDGRTIGNFVLAVSQVAAGLYHPGRVYGLELDPAAWLPYPHD